MNATRSLLFVLWVLAAIIGVMAAENFYARGRASEAAPLTRLYLAGMNTPANAIPQDTNGVIVWQSVRPQSLGDREIGVLYRIASLPKVYSSLFATMARDLKAWEDKGSKTTALYIDYAVDTPDWAGLAHMLKEMRKKMGVNYDIHLAARPQWFLKDEKATPFIGDIQNTIGFLIFDLDDAVASGQTPGAFVEALKKIQFPFYLIVDKSADTAAFHKQYTSSAHFFGGFIIALGNGNDT